MNISQVKYLLLPVLLLISYWNPVADIAAAETIRPVQLNTEEKKWLVEHPAVKIGVEQDWVPFEYFDSDGKYNGISARVMGLVKQYTGLHFEPVTGPWPATMKKFIFILNFIISIHVCLLLVVFALYCARTAKFMKVYVVKNCHH